jgi:UPF0755 protein
VSIRGGGKPRSGRGKLVQARLVVDQGWADYTPPDPEDDIGGARPSQSATRRNYRKARSGGTGSVLRFGLMAAVIGGIVVSLLYFVARPIVVNGVVDWAAENPTALSLPFVPDIVRGALASSLTEPIDAKDTKAVIVVVGAGATPGQIADQLVQAQLINDSRAFVFESIVRGVTANFQVGRHVLARSMTVDQMITALVAPPPAAPTIKVTFREGLRIEQMVALLELKEAKPDDPSAPLTMNVSQFYKLATHPTADLVSQYPWLKLPAGASLEGFLFPATYDIAPDTTPDQLIGMLLDAFASHAPPELFLLPPDQIYQKVQVAALVETEAKVEDDRALVAGVYTNRLDPKKWPTGLLDADPTLLYANDSVWLQANSIDTWVGYTFWVADWMKTSGPLGQVAFPGNLALFNTYRHAGLPPTPICSPGAASLVAAMTPDTTDGYLYFLAKNDGSGTHAFAKTQAEQNANLKKYGYVK